MPLRHRALRPALLSLLAAAVGFAPLMVGVTTPASAANTDIKVNEIITNSSTVKDSIELKNTGAAAVDVSGWIVKDDNDTRTLAIAPNSVVQPGGYLVVTVDVTGGFGLGNGDQARIFLPDGTTLIDGHTFPGHSNPSWSRCPDGTGAFVQAAAESLGAANVCATPDTAVRINEVESNDAATDWVELYNTGAGAVDISGWIVRDDKDTSAATVPAGTSLPAGGYYAVDTNVATGSTNFGLGAPDMARVFTEDGTTLIDSYSWTAHATTTYGRCPNGTGSFTTTVAGTKAAANSCPAPAGADALEINEVFSDGIDFVEVRNVSSGLVDAADFWFIDNGAPANAIRLTAESTPLEPGDLFSFEPNTIGGIGLGSADSARILLSDKTTVVDEYSWTSHRTPSYGRCPDATGLVVNAAASPGAENICQPVAINEVESSGGAPDDWVELLNVSAGAVDVSGWIFRDDDDTHGYAIPAATSIPAGGYLVLERAAFGFGLGEPDSARLLRADGTTLVDSYTWTTAAGTSYGRCANGTGAFATTRTVTKGAANDCPPPFYGVTTSAWPGSQAVVTSDAANAFSTTGGLTDMSGLAFDPTRPGVLWGIKNKNWLFKLTKVDGLWTKVTTDGWAGGKELFFTGGGKPDTEGVTVGPDGAIYATTERNNDANTVPLNAVLRFDPDAAGTTLSPTATWDLTADFPELAGIANGSNLGFEGLTFVPDSYLVAGGFIDESTGAAYDPAAYAGHGTGLYFTALENDGALYAYALGAGLKHRVAKVASGFPHVMEVTFDPERQQLWTACDDTCQGQTSHLKIGTDGKFAVVGGYDRPTGMPNLNNEGFAIAPQSTCVDGVKEVVWADDGNTGTHSLRSASLPCTMLTANVAVPEISGTARSGSTLTASTGTWTPMDGQAFSYQWQRGGTPIAGATDTTYAVVAADKGQALTVTVTATRTGYTTGSATSAPVTVEDLPLLVTAPAITGSGKVGAPLTASSGTWDETGLSYAYQWLRGSAPISGATTASYTPTTEDLAAGAVAVRVTASRAGGVSGAPATSAARTVATGDAAAASTAPAISGTARSGSTLTATTGTWTPASGLTFGYQWKRDGAAITGATAATYPVVLADKGKLLTVTVTAARAGYADGTSTATAVTVEDRPLLVTGPEVTGNRQVGSVLTASPGTWDETGLTYTYQWLRAMSPIAGATSASYPLAAADLAAGTVSVVVTATRTGGVAGVPAGSSPVPVTAGDAAVATAAPQVSGIPVVGQTLTGSAGTWSAPGVVLELQWLRDGSPIAGATGPTYRLVAADAGRAVALDVTAKRDGYADGRATSAPVTASQPASSRLRLSVGKSLKAGGKAKLTVRVSGAYDPTGKVEVTLKTAGEKAITVSGRLSNGTVRLTSPKLDAGTYQVVASYGGDDLHRGDSDTAKIKVKAKKGR